jgi:hypothetical protein
VYALLPNGREEMLSVAYLLDSLLSRSTRFESAIPGMEIFDDLQSVASKTLQLLKFRRLAVMSTAELEEVEVTGGLLENDRKNALAVFFCQIRCHQYLQKVASGH